MSNQKNATVHSLVLGMGLGTSSLEDGVFLGILVTYFSYIERTTVFRKLETCFYNLRARYLKSAETKYRISHSLLWISDVRFLQAPDYKNRSGLSVLPAPVISTTTTLIKTVVIHLE